jgi:hypothetical protein
MLIALLTDLYCVQNVAVAPIMPPAQSNAPPSSTLPINVNARLGESPSAILIACGEAGFSVNLGSVGNLNRTTLHAPVLSH